MADDQIAVDICSTALMQLGDIGIQSFEDAENDNSVLAGKLWEKRLAREVSLYPWRFAMHFVELSRDTDPPEGLYKYQFSLPVDRVAGANYSVYSDSSPYAQTTRDFHVYGDKIWSNLERLWIDYTKKFAMADTPEYFRAFMQDAMIADLAFPVTDQQNTADTAKVEAYGPDGEGGSRGDARFMDSIQYPSQRLPQENFDLINVRRGG